MISPRIIPRDLITGALVRPRAADPRHTCTRTITLDGRTYRCGRETRRNDGEHDGIHDAYAEHRGGSVRW